MPRDNSARIAQAKALAQAFGISEQEVIQAALEQASGDPAIANPAKARLAALHGSTEGLHTLDVPEEQERPDPWANLPRYSGDSTRFNVNDLQAETLEAEGRKTRHKMGQDLQKGMSPFYTTHKQQ